ncbi:MAG: hypothetical protein AAGD00_07910 [Planctomycetota bacterium]
MILPLVISAPFGNYVRPPGATPTLGTFTAERRPGRVWRIVKTLRYAPSMGAWVNKIGLRNPGIDWLAERVRTGKEDVSHAIVSIHGFDDDEWYTLIEKAAALEPLAIELNVSCPNVGEVSWPSELFERAVGSGVRTIVKIPPVRFRAMVDAAVGAGVRILHCCNTIPVPAGGMSGKPLLPVCLDVIASVRERHEGVEIIGGGGITRPGDVDLYADAGVRYAAVGTKALDPRLLWTDGPLRAICARAHERLGGKNSVDDSTQSSPDLNVSASAGCRGHRGRESRGTIG